MSQSRAVATLAAAATLAACGQREPQHPSPPPTAQATKPIAPKPARAEGPPREEREVRMLTLPSGRRVSLTAVSLPGASHAESGRLRIAYAPRRGRAVVTIGGSGFGDAPEWRLRTDIPPYPLLVVEAGWTGQGWTCGWADLVTLGPAGPRKAAFLRLSATDEGVREPSTVDFRARLAPAPRGFVAVYTGTERRRVRYRFSRGRYVARHPFLRNDC